LPENHSVAGVLRRMWKPIHYGIGAGRKLTQDPSPAVPGPANAHDRGSSPPRQAGLAPKAEDIAGFFLNFDHERLNLSVFTRNRGSVLEIPPPH